MKMSLKMEHHGGGMMPVMGPGEDEYYPDFTYESPKPLDLPDEGVMKIRFRKERSSERRMGDHTMHSCTVSVLALLSVKSVEKEATDDAPVKSDHSTEEALDAIASEMAKEKY